VNSPGRSRHRQRKAHELDPALQHTPAEQSLHLCIGGQLQVLCCLWDTWRHFLLLKLLELCDALLDDGCVAALNRLTMLEKPELNFRRQHAHTTLTACCNCPPSFEGVQL
jgi:hypothetical protein